MIATVARLLCRELTLQSEYRRLENRIPKEEVSGGRWKGPRPYSLAVPVARRVGVR